jgi:glutamine cyclotransferase
MYLYDIYYLNSIYMKKSNLHSIIAGLMLLVIIPSHGQQVIHFIPAPGTHCMDVTWDGTSIWTTDNTTQTYYKLNPVDGTVLSTIPFPDVINFSEGITFDGEYLWTCGWEETNGNGSHLFKIDPDNGEILAELDYPGAYNANWPHGITYAGGYIWANNLRTYSLDKINPSTGLLEGSIPAPGEHSIGIAWDGSYFWTNDFQQSLIFKQNPDNGEIIGSFQSPEYNMRGMEWDGYYLWMVNWQAQKIYQVDVGPLNVPELIEKTVRIYPNPGNGLFYLKADEPGSDPISILVTDITGKALKEYLIDRPDGVRLNAEIDLKELNDGIYIVNINDSGKLFREKIILKR